MIITAATLILVAAVVIYHSFNSTTAKIDTYVQFYIAQGGKFPDVFRAQIILETGSLTSDIYRENHNLVGMKCAQARSTYCQGHNKGHAVFDNDFDSIREYIFWQKSKKTLDSISSTEEYLNFLVRTGYAEDTRYIEKLANIIQNFNS